jgi:hypothetical protein
MTTAHGAAAEDDGAASGAAGVADAACAAVTSGDPSSRPYKTDQRMGMPL